MPRSRRIDLDRIGNAREILDKAAEHFGATTEKLANSTAARSGVFIGGFGKTGYFQGQLAAFSDAWQGQFEQLVADERAFVEFLRWFRERLEGARQTHEEGERVTADAFTAILRSLD